MVNDDIDAIGGDALSVSKREQKASAQPTQPVLAKDRFEGYTINQILAAQDLSNEYSK